MNRTWMGIVVGLAITVFGQPSFAEKRVALVIGNGAYGNIGALKNPPNDARLMAVTLRQLGFDVIERIDANQKTMKRAIRDFGDKLEGAGKDSVGLFYYAGHGVQVTGQNYMIPVGVEIGDEADVDIEAVAANAILNQMEFAGNRLNIVILDACRNNPFKRGFRSATRGLARMDATKGTLIAYATSPGDVAADGKGSNSPYTEALAQVMLTPGLNVERVFKDVRNRVVSATASQQVPWEASSLTGADFYFSGGAETSAVPQAAASALPAPMVDKEALFWQSIRDSKQATDYQAYLNQFPSGMFAELARSRIDALKKEESARRTALMKTVPAPPKRKQFVLSRSSHRTPLAGGTGGNAFVAECPFGEVVVGIHGRAGSWLDQIGAFCQRVTDGALTGSSRKTNAHGGSGGDYFENHCPSGEAVVAFKGRSGWFMDRIDIGCAPLKDGGGYSGNPEYPANQGGGSGGTPFEPYECRKDNVATGIHGKSGWYLDSFGLICR